VELVEGRDLFVKDDLVHAYDAGTQRVDVIYRASTTIFSIAGLRRTPCSGAGADVGLTGR